MKIDFTKSGINKRTMIVLYVLLVGFLLAKGYKSFHGVWNADRQIGNVIAIAGGDTQGYIGTMENLFTTGHYYLNEVDEQVIWRGPYYGLYYYVLRWILTPAAVFDVLAIFQILIYALAVIVLMLTIEPYLRHKVMVWFLPILIVVCNLGVYYTTCIIPETITLSQLIFFAYFYTRFNRTNSYIDLGLAALFLSMAAVIKPYLLPIFALCFLDWTLQNKVWKIKEWTKYVGIMSLPLLLICAPFTIRNAVKLRMFAPMQNTGFAGITPDPTMMSLRGLVCTWGEDYVSWEPQSLGTFFLHIDPNIDYEGEFPDVMTQDYTYDDLYQLREDYAVYLKAEGLERDSIGQSIQDRAALYIQSYKAEHPYWRFYAIYRAGKRLVFDDAGFHFNHRHNGLRHVISNSIMLTSSLVYLFILIGGFIGLLLLIPYAKDIRIMTWVTLWIIILFSYLNSGEHRFYLVGELYSVVGLVVLTDYIVKRLRGKQSCKSK